jgi:hypothetical protein
LSLTDNKQAEPTTPKVMDADIQLLKRKEELQKVHIKCLTPFTDNHHHKIAIEKNDILKGLIDKLQELQFDINAMMTVSNQIKKDTLHPTPQTKSQYIK